MGAGARMLERLAAFSATLRDNGFAAGSSQGPATLPAFWPQPLAARPTLLNQAFRTLFCSRADEWRKFDEIFAAYWLDRRASSA